MTMAQVVTAINTGISANSLDLVASNSGGQLNLTSTTPNASNSTFTVAYSVNGGNNISTLVPAGTYNGTQATKTSSGFSGTISGSGADTMTVLDQTTGRSANVSVSAGQSLATVISNLNTAFAAQTMNVSASNVGGQLKLTSTQPGTNGFTVSYAVSGDNNTAQLGIPAATYSGTASTAATHTGSGFTGTVTLSNSPDTMSVTDSVSGKTAQISIGYNQTVDDIVGALNIAFAQQNLQLTAKNTAGQLEIDQKNFGSTSTYTVAYTGPGTFAPQVGFAAGTYGGTDVQGTIGGLTATGVGQTLKGDVGGATEGISVQYVGTATGAIGTLDFAQGISGLTQVAASLFTQSGTGTIPLTLDLISQHTKFLQERADNVQGMLDRERTSLLQQFMAMESAMSKLQSMGSALTQQLSSLSSSSSK
jgi:flagellar hook-associated protein 2